MKKNVKVSISLALATTLVLGVSGCGGSSSDSRNDNNTPPAPQTNTVAGKAIDGYLQKAKVCIDLNANSQCDTNEPSATTDATGAYSITTNLTNLSQYNVLVEAVAGTTVDSDTPNTPVTKAFFLKAPANEPEVVSPMTTLVQNNLELNASLTKADVVAKLKQDLNISDSIDILGDYVAAQTTTDANISALYEKVHTVARVVTKSIAETIDTNTHITDTNYNAATKVMLEDISKKVAVIEQETQKESFNKDSYTLDVEVDPTKVVEVTNESNDEQPATEDTTQRDNNLIFENLLKTNSLYAFFFDGDLNFGHFGYGQPYTDSYEGILYDTKVSFTTFNGFGSYSLWRQYFMYDGETRHVDYYFYGYGNDFDANITIEPETHAITQESVWGVYTNNVTEVKDISGERIPAILGLIKSEYAEMYADKNISENLQPQFKSGSQLIKVTSVRTTNYNTTGETLLTKICTVDASGVEDCSDSSESTKSDQDTIVRYYLNTAAYESIDENLSKLTIWDNGN